MAHFDVIVAGSGISGMAFAHFTAEKGLSVLVLEGEDRPGGSFATRGFTDGFWLELGAHTAYASYGGFIDLLEALGLRGQVVPRQRAAYRLLVGGHLVSPLSRINLLEAALSLPRLLLGRLPKEGRSVREYYSAILGRKNYDRVFSTVISAVVSQSADAFPADMLLKRRPRREGYPRSFTLKGGLGSVIDRIAANERVHLRTGAAVTAVSRSGGAYRLTLRTGAELCAARICLATPPSVTQALLRGIDTEAAGMLADLAPVVRVESLGLAVPKGRVALGPFAFILARDEPFTSVVSRDVIPDETMRGFAFHFRSERLDLSAKVAEASRLLGADPAAVKTAETVHLCPSLRTGHRDRLQSLKARLEAHKGLSVVGNYFEGLSFEDCVLRAQAEADRLQG